MGINAHFFFVFKHFRGFYSFFFNRFLTLPLAYMETDNLYRNRLFCILIDILFDFCQLLLSKGRKTVWHNKWRNIGTIKDV